VSEDFAEHRLEARRPPVSVAAELEQAAEQAQLVALEAARLRPAWVVSAPAELDRAEAEAPLAEEAAQPFVVEPAEVFWADVPRWAAAAEA
jgi:hypothetical protein